MEDFTAAIASDPKMAEAYNNRGVLLGKIYYRHGKAVENLAKAVELEKKNPGYWINYGAVLLKNMDYWKAITALDKAIELQAPKERALLYRADARFSLGDRTRAYKDIQAALKIAPDSPELYTMLGGFRLRSKDYPRALQHLKKALGLSKANPQTYLYRGLAYAALGEYRSAVREFRQRTARNGLGKIRNSGCVVADRSLMEYDPASLLLSSLMYEVCHFAEILLRRFRFGIELYQCCTNCFHGEFFFPTFPIYTFIEHNSTLSMLIILTNST